MKYITCACTPGTYEDGWQERRCAECIEIEVNLWREMLQAVRTEEWMSKWTSRAGRVS